MVVSIEKGGDKNIYIIFHISIYVNVYVYIRVYVYNEN